MIAVLITFLFLVSGCGGSTNQAWQCPQSEADYDTSNPPDNAVCAYVNGVLEQ